MRAAIVALVALVASLPAGAAQTAPLDYCPNNGGSYQPYSTPAAPLRVSIRIEGAPIAWTWCLFQGESLLLMRWDLVQTKDPGRPHVFQDDSYPVGEYTISMQTGTGLVAGGREEVRLEACGPEGTEVWFRLVQNDPAPFRLEHGTRCIQESVTPTIEQDTPEPARETPAPAKSSWMRALEARDASAAAAPEMDPSGFLAATMLVAVAVAALSAAKIRFAFLVLLGRTLGERVLQHPTRRGLVEAIERQPGIHASGLRDLLGLAEGGLRHHLAILELRGLVDGASMGGFRRYFPKGTFSSDEQRTLAVLCRPAARQVYDALRTFPGDHQSVCDRVRISRGQFSKIAYQLLAAGLVERSSDRGRARWIALALPSRLAPYLL